MQGYPLSTDGGPHSPDKWAAMTAKRIVSDMIPAQIMIDDDSVHSLEGSSHPKIIALRKARDRLELEIRDLVEDHHHAVQRKARADKGLGIGKDLKATVADHVDVAKVAAAIVALANEAHPGLGGNFKRDDVAKDLVDRLHMDFGSVIDIERDYRAKGLTVGDDHKARPNPSHNPNDPEVKAWHAIRHPGPHASIKG